MQNRTNERAETVLSTLVKHRVGLPRINDTLFWLIADECFLRRKYGDLETLEAEADRQLNQGAKLPHREWIRIAAVLGWAQFVRRNIESVGGMTPDELKVLLNAAIGVYYPNAHGVIRDNHGELIAFLVEQGVRPDSGMLRVALARRSNTYEDARALLSGIVHHRRLSRIPMFFLPTLEQAAAFRDPDSDSPPD